ncbi:MAG: hypothetical protein ABH871_07060 [Pseudomonadota bacterium]
MRKGKKLLNNIHQESRDVHGGIGGLFIPSKQPSPNYFLIVVGEDDRGGRIALIKKNGDVIEFPGGNYFVSKDDNFLFADYFNEFGYKVIIFDLNKDRILFSKEFEEPNIDQWYKKGEEFFFTESEWLQTISGHPSKKHGVINVVDFQGNRIVKKDVPIDFLLTADKFDSDFIPGRYKSCNSKMIEQ